MKFAVQANTRLVDLRILYLAHDLSDAAIWRRVHMLNTGGAVVDLAGFSRASPVTKGPAKTMTCFGLTKNGGFIQRIAAVGRSFATMRKKIPGTPKPDLIIARNLEMLALSGRVRAQFGRSDIPIVYECLDIHHLMLRRDVIGWALRKLERALMRKTSLLITSSPGFVRNYFDRFDQCAPQTQIVENKMLQNAPPHLSRVSDGKLSIGWFGILRCQKSLHFLDQITRNTDGRIQVSLRGKPAYDVMPDFDQIVANNPFLHFGGPYRYPDDLADIYSQVDLAWLLDFYQQGENSDWLLPNRLYEGCAHGAVPLVRATTETARFLQKRKIGAIIDTNDADKIATQLEAINITVARRAVQSEPQSTWICSDKECAELVTKLSQLNIPQISLSKPKSALQDQT
ncbi:glycosyl transferase family 1 [Parasulfitobacter algicola]|uniref:Glycosyl transferase family 1 n=1 Tax=Parasulfitobacter algicola TaxID=2614809 RepID=A0ABX2IXI0_9RHOB|nr:glycosyl transferase family 1 [Sulfitobacter algicola]NSX54893.1 glycosyl transferase family 1 [Sulfitobacter algicola]